MKITSYILSAILALVGLSCSQVHNNQGRSASSIKNSDRTSTAWDQVDAKGDAAALRRLESVTWDSVKHQLSWDVSRGERKGEAYEPQSKDRYAINMDTATMTVNGETRRFSAEEATNVRTLMDFISRYALESTVWWENGEGDPTDGSAPARPERQTPQRTPQAPTTEGKSKAIKILQQISVTE